MLWNAACCEERRRVHPVHRRHAELFYEYTASTGVGGGVGVGSNKEVDKGDFSLLNGKHVIPSDL